MGYIRLPKMTNALERETWLVSGFLKTVRSMAYWALPSGLDRESANRATVLVLMCFTLGLPAAYFGLQYWLLGMHSVAIPLWFGLGLAIAIPLAVKFTKVLNPWADFTVLMMFGILGPISAWTGGLYSTGVLWMGLIPLVAVSVAGWRSGVFWLLVNMTVVSYFIYDATQNPLTSYPSPNTLSRVVSVVALQISTLVLLSLLGAFESELRREYQAASREKTRFLAIMSHELRTPMNGIVAMTELFLDSEVSPEQRRDAETILRSTLHLSKMLNDVLDISKVESRKSELDRESFALRECLSGVLALVTPEIQAKGLKLETRIDPSLPDNMVGDQGRLRQILLNLLTNAIKFTSAGQIEFQAEAKENVGGRLLLQCSVSDTGTGISREEQDKLFKPFGQAADSDAFSPQGAGLGLLLSRQFARSLGGDIRLTSELGKGSTFTLEMPLEIATEEAESPQKAGKQELASLSGYRVLVAEDDSASQVVVRRLLERMGLECTMVDNGADAIAAYSKESFDLILMDCQMPIMDGLVASQKLREKGHKDVPIVAVTANAFEEDKQRCFAAGMTDFLAKPIRKSSLENILRTNLARGGERESRCTQ